MSMKTLELMAACGADEDDLWAEAERRDEEFRATKTPAGELASQAQTVYDHCVAKLPTSLKFRPHGDASPQLKFEVPLNKAYPSDVMARAMAMFDGWTVSHNHSVFYRVDWAERLMQPAIFPEGA